MWSIRGNRASAIGKRSRCADAVIQKKTDVLKKRRTEENIRLQVLTAINQLENSQDTIKKRCELGTITLFFVLASQIQPGYPTMNFRRNQINLLQRTGRLLEERGIVIQ